MRTKTKSIPTSTAAIRISTSIMVGLLSLQQRHIDGRDDRSRNHA
jgi:hypothetical protein